MTTEKKHISRFAKILAFSALAAGTSLCGSGCATIFSGVRQDVDIDSQPSGAEVFVNGNFAGRTPLTLELMREEHPLIVLKKEGYADTRVRIERGTNGWLGANVLLLPFPPLLGPLFGLGFDSRAGAEDSYSETDIIVPLFSDEKEPWLAIYDGNVVLENCSPDFSEASLLTEASEPSATSTAEQEILSDALRKAISAKLPPLHRSSVPEVVPGRAGAPARFVRGKEVRVRIRERAEITVSREGRITNYSLVESGAKEDVRRTVMKTLAAVTKTFVAPEEAASALPVTLVVPVESR